MKSKAQYLLRFDDLCPTMKWTMWDRVEKVLDEFDVKPIVAVVPDNQDPALSPEAAREDFWEKVRTWQKKGWTIALHGYRHVYENKKGGLLRVNDYSEFAGVPLAEQERRIREGLRIFSDHGVRCDAWVAPAHSFDKNTVKVLRENGVGVISDGYSNEVFEKFGVTWVPCQLYRFEERESGVWTVCKHPSMWGEREWEAFRKELEEHHHRFTDLSTLLSGTPTLTPSHSRRQWRISRKRLRKIFWIRKIKNGLDKCKMIRIKRILAKILKKIRGGDEILHSRKKGVTIGENCRLIGMPRWGSEPWLITLGDHVEISLNVTFITHDGATWCFRDEERYRDVIRYGKICIKDNCFVGANATILPGVTIGPNSIVGAGSLVNKDVEPDSVYAGVPARRICSMEEYAEKCLRETPDYDKEAYRANKRAEVLRVLDEKEKE